MARATPTEHLYAATMSAHDPKAELVFDLARASGYVAHSRQTAEKAAADDLIVAELAEVAERLAALHLVALVSGGWCASPSCGAELTEPDRSPTGARHCRTCRMGWVLIEEDQRRLRAVAQPWPAR